ncbi:DUF559 domain-containing protein [Agrococcus sp. SL85]|uniref:DUF559 domain-containing protein n=1 Tax=Agrococcus sp. SL85 TaxID=2995141 RepID=UPI00226D2920|nr:DUF559 domain-containing protein [Agrococcus sp. SL85]WAC65868.1 DUF559 domain-containing protein [Agrococcus sp. SL85]
MQASRAFSVRDAIASGVTRGELRGGAWCAPAHGIRVTGSLGDTAADFAEAVRAAAGPDQFFSHLTAARIHGMPLPARLADDRRIHVASPTGRSRMVRPGVVGHRLKSEVIEVDGLRVEALPDAFVHLATILTVDELVAVGDWLVCRDRRQALSVEDLRDAIRRYDGARGLVRARRAVALVRVGAESPQETATRLLLVRGGLPEPVLQHEAFDERGTFVGRLDLAWPALRLAVEYDGEGHFTSHEQGERDIARLRELERLGWTVIRITRRDLRDGGARVLAHIARVHARLSAR